MTDAATKRGGQNLFVMVHGTGPIWRLLDYSESTLFLQGPAPKFELLAACKCVCRVGEARNWRDSISFSRAWRLGGGDLFE
jgi:hypothetical protein